MLELPGWVAGFVAWGIPSCSRSSNRMRLIGFPLSFTQGRDCMSGHNEHLCYGRKAPGITPSRTAFCTFYALVLARGKRATGIGPSRICEQIHECCLMRPPCSKSGSGVSWGTGMQGRVPQILVTCKYVKDPGLWESTRRLQKLGWADWTHNRPCESWEGIRAEGTYLTKWRAVATGSIRVPITPGERYFVLKRTNHYWMYFIYIELRQNAWDSRDFMIVNADQWKMIAAI
jgi:hypothetical protein